MSESRVIHGFHAVTSRLRSAPDGVREIFVDGARADRRSADLVQLAKSRNVRVVDYPGFKKISAAEVARATGGHPQEKFTRIDEMLAVLN